MSSDQSENQNTPPPFHSQFHALRALAIRERKIHVIGQLQLNTNGSDIFLDVEGIPDRDFYYLIELANQKRGIVRAAFILG